METIVGAINGIVWNYVLVYGLVAVGLYYTVRLGFMQFIRFGEMLRCIVGSRETDRAGITPFQALATSLAARVGTGNMAGVAVAITLGGPGAIFWMWIVALVGMATAYAESTLAQLFKTVNDDGEYRGGPGFYMARGLGAPWAGALFSVFFIISFGLIFNSVQANAIAEAVEGAYGLPRLPVGIGIAVLTAVVVFGGLRVIATVAEYVVPLMAGIYVLVALVILLLNLPEVPGMLLLIVKSAFGLDQAAGGVAGGLTAAALNGIKRGLFSNEAGMGSAPMIAAAATPQPHHPSSQGFVQAFGVFVDTILVCTATALMILLSGVLDTGSEVTGMQLTQDAMTNHIGSWGATFIAVAIFFFAFTSIIANFAYAENALLFLGFARKLPFNIYRLAALAMVVWGSVQPVRTVFATADASMGLMATINLIAIALLSGTVVKLTRDYFAQRDQGHEPVFRLADYPELENKVNSSIWNAGGAPRMEDVKVELPRTFR